jgi:lauroyl/myristoyl acyltransferase
MLRETVFRVIRGAGGALPVPVLAAVLYPVALARAFTESLIWRGRRPPRSLPPAGRGATFATELSARTAAWMSTASLLWADRFATAQWRDRFDVQELDAVRAAAAERPVVIATIHFGGIFVMPSLLRAFGIPTAAVVGDKIWPVRWWRERRARLTEIDGLPAHLRAGDARAIVRYLQPGRCLLVALDYPLGEQALTPYGGTNVRLSTPAFRLARITNATVLPVLVRADGLLRFAVHVGRPVPDDVVARGDDYAALAHVVNELLPVAAIRPEQSLPLLVNAFERSVSA